MKTVRMILAIKGGIIKIISKQHNMVVNPYHKQVKGEIINEV